MDCPTDDTGAENRNDVFEALSNGRRRTALAVLRRMDRARPDELATYLVAEEADEPLMDVERPAAESAQLALEHRHLPCLADAGLVTWEDGVVRTTGHPAFRDPKVDVIIDADGDGWDDVLDCLADKRRRIVLTTLYRHGEPMDRDELAAAVTETAQGDAAVDVGDVLTDLHHVHLPKLAGAGLVAYDADGETVAYEGHPDIDEEWLVAGPTDTPRAILSMADQSADIWSIEGRDNVTERGRALCRAADEELFMMFTIEGTVETACVRRIRDALDRGVDVYLGTQNRELRDLVRENAPEVTIWEPQLDWLNLPPTREKVGRLILADREEIMIGTIGEVGPDGVPRETAITGTGEDNPLVMLLREMLGARLDHLDAQSEDFRSQIPL